ncbi:urease accessory protein UreF, putative [Acanthamoeba castellanii str. Neff]|uniref:Urease accessory protein UreF, putative n=1 Tax=Acanthamoeba castellanii (strain ATCC 30010 / Neff) TaxID=1257118 RepID=L8GQ53_ACACF|nr:urease accessory protein UreF, putative [Acanthamoeba castellanii str. Neff]ELR15314.1 urease accessory protein UreF, putative [Acanthamoeba castellanii str. Neff]
MGGDWLVWQLIDSAFPTGGFVHSGGLETAAQAGLIYDGKSLEQYLQEQLNQTASTTMKVAVSAHRALDKSQPFDSNFAAFAEVDRLMQAMTTNHVANRASRAQGMALLSTAASCLAESELGAYKRAIYFSTPSLYGHYAPVFGLVCKMLDVPLETTKQMFLFVVLRSLISSAVRLNLTGPLEGQRLQLRCSTYAEALLERDAKNEAKATTATQRLRKEEEELARMKEEMEHKMSEDQDHEAALKVDTKVMKKKETFDLPPDHDCYQTSPLLDLVQGMHDRLYSRLFNT